MKKEIHLSLTGGLGNQLFQLAAALSYNNSSIVLETNLGKPRRNSGGEPEISSYILPDNVKFSDLKKERWLHSKSIGFGLRMGIAPKGYERLALSRCIVNFAASVINSFYCRRFIRTWFSQDIGYNKLPEFNPVLLVGYFQSYKWPFSESSFNALRNLTLNEVSPELNRLSQKAIQDFPLVVHVRLGDYLAEDSFGIPSNQYYAEAIKSLWSSGEYGRIWVFSDQIESAKVKIPEELWGSCDWIHEVGISSASTLEAMRFGKGYVLANSSFSWWGCFLSHTLNPKVVAPDPWFKGLPRPTDITPPSWTLMPAEYESSN